VIAARVEFGNICTCRLLLLPLARL
jgi:hypothetical protein